MPGSRALPRPHPRTAGQLELRLPGVRTPRSSTGPGRPSDVKPDRTRPGGRNRPPNKPVHAAPRLRVAPPSPIATRDYVPVTNMTPPQLPPGVSLPRVWDKRTEVLDGVNRGKVRVSVPGVRGEAIVFRPNPDTMYRADLWARNVTAAAGAAMWEGRRTTMDALTDADDPTEPKRRPMPTADELAARAAKKATSRVSYAKDRDHRPDVANPAEWTPNSDGTWLSPKGERWRQLRPGTIEARRKMGLPLSWEEHVAMCERGATG